MINQSHIIKIAQELKLRPKQVLDTAELLDGGSTVPFISRYRKEVTGSLDEVAVTAIRDRVNELRELDKRREAVLESIEKQGKLTPELKDKIVAAETMSVLEDLYLPYKPKRRTRAIIAKEKGLEPLAEIIFKQDPSVSPQLEAVKFIDPEKKVATVEEALAGARDIIAEWVSEDAPARAKMRALFFEQGIFKTKVILGKEKDGIKFRDYFDWQEAVNKAPSHRALAMRRGEKEEILTLRVLPPEEEAFKILIPMFVKGKSESSREVAVAVDDSYKRLLSLSIETEIRMLTKQKADEEAIRIFAQNLRQLLMAPPLGRKNVLAVDPGFRTGCKLVCLDRQGKLVYNTAVYLADSGLEARKAVEVIKDLCLKYEVEFIAIGNGTASRETEMFIRKLGLKNIQVVMVNESGASIYSASDVARQEFPDFDVTVRGSVSIGRRLQDPLSELVKIDPKSIGVGQYQHDVDQSKLKNSLDDVVISCVNHVGVELNSASKQLLMYVSGFGPALAQAIVDYRNNNGPYQSREDIRKVPKLSTKAFEQAAGFLRIREAKNPMDSSAVHPESYPIVEQMAQDVSCQIKDLMTNDLYRKKINLQQYVTQTIGLPTLTDILEELSKPGRDPRQSFEVVQFADNVHTLEDLKIGMKLTGVITNITDFGAFVDVGVHHDGLIHKSEMSDKFVRHPSDAVKVQQKVRVTVLDVDMERRRIALSMRK